MQTNFKSILINSLPIAVGYLFMGFAFGVLYAEKGGSVLGGFLMGFIGFAGSAQFLALGFLSEGTAFLTALAALTLLNLRHIFYGITAIHDLGPWNLKKIYLIFALTDENFGLYQYYRRHTQLNQNLLLKVFSLDHFYWVVGCTSGAFLATQVSLQVKGLDFALTALFVILAVENYWSVRGDNNASS